MTIGKTSLLCKHCHWTNEADYLCCINCGSPLYDSEDFLTKPLDQTRLNNVGEKDTGTPEEFHRALGLNLSDYVSDAAPNEWFQQRMIDVCAVTMRQLINRMNLLKRSCEISPVKEGAGMNDYRFEILIEMKDLLAQFEALLTILMSQEFKAKI